MVEIKNVCPIAYNTQIAATAIPYPLENQTKFKPEQPTNKTK